VRPDRRGYRSAAALADAERLEPEAPLFEMSPLWLHLVRCDMVRLDVQGTVVSIDSAQAERLRTIAAVHAGSFSRLRDLALVLDLALASPRVVVLRRAEARELLHLVAATPELTEVAHVLDSVRRVA
jgi:hypothetical protein